MRALLPLAWQSVTARVGCATRVWKPSHKLASAYSTKQHTPPPASMAEEVQISTEGAVAVVTWNRPQALNALNTNMVETLLHKLSEWQKPNCPVHAVVVRGAGGKAFCAGGDVKWVVQQSLAGNPVDPMRFFTSEYRMNYMIAKCAKPYIALIDGIVMGGGVGASIHGHFRVATERTVFAMPECGIGLFPDVGASFFLHKMPGFLGLYLGLTGARLTGYECKLAGVATHFLPSTAAHEVIPALQALGPLVHDLSQVNQVLTDLQLQHQQASSTGPVASSSSQSASASAQSASANSQSASANAPLASINDTSASKHNHSAPSHIHSAVPHLAEADAFERKLQLVNYHFSKGSVEEIVQSLQQGLQEAGSAGNTASSAFLQATLQQLQKGSPLSQKVTFELLRRMHGKPLADCLEAELKLVEHFVHGKADFNEGVRATLIDKGSVPNWKYATLSDVPDAVVSDLLESASSSRLFDSSFPYQKQVLQTAKM